MKQIQKFQKFQNMLKGLTFAIARFPLTSVCLLAAMVMNAIDINRGDANYSKYLLTLVVGAFLGAVSQVAYERYFSKISSRVVLIGTSALLTLCYLLTILPAPELTMEIGIRTSVALFALFIAFVWIPSIKSRITFNESFMVAFKAFFISIFFAAVIFAGISIIIAAIDQLLFNVDTKAYPHTANIVFILYAPIYFLSLIPVYPGRKDRENNQENIELQQENIGRMSGIPKFLEILISYIIIPLAAVFTVILLIYIVINIGSKFWTDNLLEPMIVSYSIIVILVYILASRLENKFASLFRRVFPKVLVPIMVFQTISSILRTAETGITHGRYYVILFGIFATAAGIILSFVPVRKNGIIAAMLIVFSAVSIVPPVDAFTISRTSQINLLERVLIKNEMIEDDQIQPNMSISEEDRKKINQSVSYLNRMDYLSNIPWLPSDFDYYSDFSVTFGFSEYSPEENRQYASLFLPQNTPINVAGFDFIVSTNIYSNDQSMVDEEIGVIEKSGQKYSLLKKQSKKVRSLVLVNDNNEELLSFLTDEMFEKFEKFEYSESKEGILSVEEATFSVENQLAAIRVVVQNVDINKDIDQANYRADLYVLVQIKDR